MKQITKWFGKLLAVNNLSFDIAEGEVVGLIGPNGAGKTTVFNLISGVYQPDEGVIEFEGEKISQLRPDQICKRGISRTFQLMQPFLSLTTLQNALVGVLFGREEKISTRQAVVESMKILELLGLKDKKDVEAKNLTLMERKLLELARALATKPKLLLLDEPMAGLTYDEIEKVLKIIRSVNQMGITVLLIEHHMKAVMSICQRIVVLDHGEKIAEGTPVEVSKARRVLEVYLGETYAT